MKKFLLISALALSATGAGAQKFDFLTLCTNNGPHTSLPVNHVKLTVEGDRLVAEAGEERATFELSSLSAMFFATENTTGIASGLEAAPACRWTSGGRLTVFAPAGTAVTVYAADGRRAASFVKTRDGEETFAPALSAGVYLVNMEERTFKILAR